MATSFKRSHACTATLTAPNSPAGHHWPTPLLETPGHSQTSLGQSLVGSLLLSSGSWCTRFCCALQESISHSYVSSGSCMVGLMATSSKRTYSIPKLAAPRAPVPLAVHCWPVPPQEMLKHSSVSVFVGPWVVVRTRFVWALWELLAGMGFDSKLEIHPSYHLAGVATFAFGRGVSPHSLPSAAQPPCTAMLTLSSQPR